MNKNEQKAFNWLLKQGLSKEDIHFHSKGTPDFTTPLGGFEVKTFHKRKNGYIIHISESQIKKIEESSAKVLCFLGESEEPRVATIDELRQANQIWRPPEYPPQEVAGRITFFRTIRKFGGSFILALPTVLLKAINLKVEELVQLYLEDSRLIIEKVKP